MGKKYVVEIGRLERLYKVSTSAKGMPNMTWLSPKVDLTPYTEPDLERVKKTAHDDGYSEGYQAGRGDLNQVLSDVESDVEQIRKEAYEEGKKQAKVQAELDVSHDIEKVARENYKAGLSDAWDAAKKIALMDTETSENVTGYFGLFRIMENLTPMQAIEKIRQYEQEQKEFHVGDEVELKCGVRPAIYMQGTKGSDEIYLLFNDGSCGVHSKSEIERKTGRHFHEIATILENMRGEQDG